MRKLEQTKEEIIEWLQKKDDNASTILVEDTGMGKSWMAKEISECTIEDGSCYATLWVYVTEKYDINLFHKDIARQLCVITEEWEYEDTKTVSNLKTDEFIHWGHTEEEMKEETLTERVREKMKEIGNTLLSVEEEYLLLVLDDARNDLTNSNAKLPVELSDDWRSLFPTEFQNRLKIIITTKFAGHYANQTSKVIQFPRHLQQEESLELLQKRANKMVSENQYFQGLDGAIAGKSEGKPVAIIVIAETLNNIARADDASKLESAILRAAYNEKTSPGVNPLIYCAFDMIKNSVTRNCFWRSMQLFRNYGGVHYNELICHWIMEGYLDPFDKIEEAYRKGHDVLMELIHDRALLMIQDNNIVTMEGEVLNMIHSCPLTATLRFNVSLGRVTRMNGVIKTLCNPRSWEKNTTLLIDGSHMDISQSLFKSMKEPKVLAVFNSTNERCESLISSLSKVDNLLVLVIRINKPKVQETSGDSQLSSFPAKLFDGMVHLQSLNLSGLGIKSLPSLSNLRELRSLILGQLSYLEKMQSLKALVNLEILDLSGAGSLKSMPSDLFDEITKLQSLNLSGLKLIESLPSFSKLSELRVLILSGCSRLQKLPSLRGLGKLELLDLSDATSFESFDDPTLSVLPKIQKIDLSNTSIQSLPRFDQLKELKHIFLSGCRNLGDLPTLRLLTSLQILDLSRAVMFKTFEDQSIENLDQLRILDLSGTSIIVVPEIPRNLLELNLMDCSLLKELPSTIGRRNLRTNDAGWVPTRLSN